MSLLLWPGEYPDPSSRQHARDHAIVKLWEH